MDEHDPQFVALEKQIARTAPGEARAQLEARRDQIHGQNVGRIFTNEYSRMGFLNWERNKDYYHKLIKEGNEQYDKPEGHTSADLDYKLVKESTLFKEQQMKNAATLATNQATGPVADLYGRIAEKAAELANEFPILTAAVTGASSAFQAINSFGGGLLAAWAGKKVLGKLGGAGAATAAEGAEVAAKSGGVLSRIGGVLGGGSGILGKIIRAPLAEGYLAYNQFYDQFLERGDDKVKRLKEDGYGISDKLPRPVGFLDAFDEIKSFFSQSNTAKPTSPVATTPWAPQAPQQPVVANIYLDSRPITEAVLRRVDVDARRQ